MSLRHPVHNASKHRQISAPCVAQGGFLKRALLQEPCTCLWKSLYPVWVYTMSIWINESSVNPKSTSNQSSKPCTVLQYPSREGSVSSVATQYVKTSANQCTLCCSGQVFEKSPIASALYVPLYLSIYLCASKKALYPTKSHKMSWIRRISIYIHIYIYVCMYVHIYTYVFTYIHIYMYVCTPI